MQNENVREQTAERVARDTIKAAQANLHIRVNAGETMVEGEGNGIGMLIAVSAAAETYITGWMEDGGSLEKCKGGLRAALNQAIRNAEKRYKTD